MKSSTEFIKTLLFTFAVFAVFLMQLFTLNYPHLNGDEAVYMTVVEEFRKLLDGNLPPLNPIISYSGPIDFWIMGSVYGLFSFFSSIEPGAWMVRIVPFLLFWAGSIALFFELKNWSKSLAKWFLFISALAPITLVYSRASMPHSPLLGIMALLIAESLRVQRGAKIRWIWSAFLAGYAVETNTSAFIGLFAVFAPVLLKTPVLVKKNIWKALAAFSLFILMAFPVVKNFPPPLNDGMMSESRWLIQIRSMINVVSGYQPFKYWLDHDSAPVIIVGALIGFVFFIWIRHFVYSTSKSRSQAHILKNYWLSHILSALMVVWICGRGRSLETLGYERYLLTIVPGWVLLTAASFDLFCKKYVRTGYTVAVLFFLLQIYRFELPIIRNSSTADNSLAAARWLEKNCPSSTCLAYAENFWNYWPVRFYSRDSFDLNFAHHNWKKVITHERRDRVLAGCWYIDSKVPYRGKSSSQITFDSSPGNPAQICYYDIQL